MGGKAKKRIIFLLAGIAFIVLTSVAIKQPPDARSIIAGVLKSIAAIKTLTYEQINMERKSNGKMRKDSSAIKYQKLPYRVYMKMSGGAEVLWGPDINNGEIHVHPNSFPYFNLNLDPNGSIMRKNQHHGIGATGYDYFSDILQAVISKAGNDFNSHFLYLGEITFNGIQCYNIMAIDRDFKYVSYTVQKGETLVSIGAKLSVDEYMIQVHNNLSSIYDVKEGQTIMVPTVYGKEMALYIDKTTMLPALLKVSDDKGLFEEYHFRNMKVNPGIKPEEFTRGYSDYHF